MRGHSSLPSLSPRLLQTFSNEVAMEKKKIRWRLMESVLSIPLRAPESCFQVGTDVLNTTLDLSDHLKLDFRNSSGLVPPGCPGRTPAYQNMPERRVDGFQSATSQTRHVLVRCCSQRLAAEFAAT